MHTTKYIFAGIMSAIIGTAHATGENIIAAKSYVDTQDALKQDLIDAEMMTISIPKAGINQTVPTLVSYDNTNGLTGDSIGLVKSDTFGTYSYNDNLTWWWNDNYNSAIRDNTVLTSGAARNLALKLKSDIDTKQDKIPASGYDQNGSAYTDAGYLLAGVAGTGLVTRTSGAGQVGERKIFEASDVSGYHAQGLTQDQINVQDISIPTVGAMMNAIQNGVETFRIDTAEITAIQNYSTTFDDTTNNWPAADGNKLINGATFGRGLAEKQNKMTCAGWPESVAVADRTDENCWLWNKN